MAAGDHELVRARVLGNPWAAIGYGQVGVDTLVQIADVAGLYGVVVAGIAFAITRQDHHGLARAAQL